MYGTLSDAGSREHRLRFFENLGEAAERCDLASMLMSHERMALNHCAYRAYVENCVTVRSRPETDTNSGLNGLNKGLNVSQRETN